MIAPEWFRGVPWERRALAAARAEHAAEAVTEVARGFIEAAKHDPTQTPHLASEYRAVRGQFTAIIDQQLIVVGYGVGEQKEAQAEPQQCGGRGPRDYDELTEWLADEGYAVVLTKGGHRAVLNSSGVRVATLSSSASDYRTFKNDVAACRRATDAQLRRKQ